MCLIISSLQVGQSSKAVPAAAPTQPTHAVESPNPGKQGQKKQPARQEEMAASSNWAHNARGGTKTSRQQKPSEPQRTSNQQPSPRQERDSSDHALPPVWQQPSQANHQHQAGQAAQKSGGVRSDTRVASRPSQPPPPPRKLPPPNHGSHAQAVPAHLRAMQPARGLSQAYSPLQANAQSRLPTPLPADTSG